MPRKTYSYTTKPGVDLTVSLVLGLLVASSVMVAPLVQTRVPYLVERGTAWPYSCEAISAIAYDAVVNRQVGLPIEVMLIAMGDDELLRQITLEAYSSKIDPHDYAMRIYGICHASSSYIHNQG